MMASLTTYPFPSELTTEMIPETESQMQSQTLMMCHSMRPSQSMRKCPSTMTSACHCSTDSRCS